MLLPTRPLVASLIGAGLAVMLSEAPGSAVPLFIIAVASIAAVWPPDEGEIKKPFRRTERVTRLLVVAFLVAVFDITLYAFLVSLVGLEDVALQAVAVMGCGLLTFLTVSLILISANILLMPVESFMRRRFVASARRVMAEIQPTVIGITGSYGKTTTKHFLADILNSRYRAYATPKSYNTMMGISMAINNDLANNYAVDYFIVEMGAYIRGEIARICDLTPPYVGIVVEVGPQHLERFGSLEATAEAKYELIANLPSDGVGVFNWDNKYVRDMYERGYPQTRIAVSKTVAPQAAPEDGPRFIATDVSETLNGLSFTVHDRETGDVQPFTVPIAGEHNVTNLLLATAVAVQEGMSLRDVAFRVRQLQPVESRLVRQTTPQGITIINDAYSANPAGVVSALKSLGLHTGGKRVLITPGMIELGDMQAAENQRLGEIAARYATDVILVGEGQTRPVQEGLAAAGFPPDRLRVVDELREAVAWYQTQLKPGDTVLFLNDLPDTY
jgi:UDP-N-acetylmuramoyl-tripeptide--D-alanyl-D-alanine ligase